MDNLVLNKTIAYTVNSCDNEVKTSNKGVYKTYTDASKYTKGVGWYGSDGTVEELKDVYQGEDGKLYQVKCLGYPTNVIEEHKQNLLKSITSKLTDEELEFISKNKIGK